MNPLHEFAMPILVARSFVIREELILVIRKVVRIESEGALLKAKQPLDSFLCFCHALLQMFL